MPAHTKPHSDLGNSVHNIDIGKLFTHTTTYMLSAIDPVQLKPGFIREEHKSPACQRPLKVRICPQNLVMTPNCSQVKTLVMKTSMQMSFPEMVSDSLWRNSLVVQTLTFISCPGYWS